MQPILVLAALGGTDCEQIGTGWLAQPANAVSSLAFVAVGGWLLHGAAGRPADRVPLVAAGTAMAGVGLASVAYHGPQPAWAEPVHDGSIAGLGVVLVGLVVRRVAQRGRRAAAVDARSRWAVGACWAAALLAYAMGRTGSPFCHPESLWQPHAAWHVLSAIALGVAILIKEQGQPSDEKGERTDKAFSSPWRIDG
ncbi:MAG: hypothetical protein ACRD0O_09950 [Acidimicrobiia bacterium]